MRCGWIRGRIAGGLCRRFRSLVRGGGGGGGGGGWVGGGGGGGVGLGGGGGGGGGGVFRVRAWDGMGVWLACGVAYQRGVGWDIMDGAPWQVWGFGRDLETVGRWLSDEYHGNHWGGCDGEIGGRGVLCVWVGVHIMRVVYRFAIDTPRYNSVKEQFAFAGSL